MEYSKENAIEVACDFIKELNHLEKKYNMKLNSDTGDVYLTFRTTAKDRVWDNIKLGWIGDGSGIKVLEQNFKERIKAEALSKLTDEEREVLGL